MDKNIKLISIISLSTLVIIAGYFTIQSNAKQNRISKLKQQLNVDLEILTRDEPIEHNQELIREQLSRNYAFLGELGQSKVRDAFVIVVGLGGVGSHAAHMLLRAGVKKLRLIDFDQLTLSSLNRHAVGTVADVGLSKAAVLKKHFNQIAPFVEVESIVSLFSAENAYSLLKDEPDYVLDCIDNIGTKIELIQYCQENKLKMISSMGASGKADPTRICIADICDTSEDPLARRVRQLLKKKGIYKNVKCVFSIEKETTNGLLELEEHKKEESDEYAALPNFRSRILPVLGTIPALFGNTMATHVITELSDFFTDPLSNKLRHNTYCRLHQELVSVLNGPGDRSKISLDVGDVGFIFEEVWKGKSAISGNIVKLGLHKWDKKKPGTIGNLICMTKKEAIAHSKLEVNQFSDYYCATLLAYIQTRFELGEKMNALRETK